MRILILDDDHRRHELFLKHFAQKDVDYLQIEPTADGAEHALSTQPKFDVLMLDFDLVLNQPSIHHSVHTNGVKVAQFVTRMPDEAIPDKIVVHSMNPIGADRIVRYLASHGIINVFVEPFNLKE
jgi:hypothetical protein